jgi:hypothetical protein
MTVKTQYRITNTTIKPEKLVNGRDTRKVIEKIGYSIQFYDAGGQPITLPPGQSRLTQELNDGLINFNDMGLVKVEKIENVANLLQDHTSAKTTKKRSPAKKKGSEVNNGTIQGSN